ncbi:MAG: ribosome small subunit-dependent GTPase A [Clostridia bacterium]|nr:ribosome small subunit-dependent GTPase A [Clostridia bacterium]
MIGRLIKVCSNGYTVRCEEKDYPCKAKGKLKISGDGLYVGDYVEIENGVIAKVLPRKNKLIRPRVSNIDAIVVVVAVEPKPDYYLVDKVVLSGIKNDIETVILVNKSDKDKNLFESVKSQYDGVAKVYSVSAKDKVGIEQVKEFLQNKTVVLAGQSAVGKTTLVNAIFSLDLRVGELSEKIQRGKHTTTYSQIFIKDNVSVIDSPGFAQIEAFVDLEELPNLYQEYLEYASECRFRGCTHTDEPDCQVKKAVEEGKLSKERYVRYVEIYNQIKCRRKDYE